MTTTPAHRAEQDARRLYLARLAHEELHRLLALRAARNAQ